MRKKSFSKRKKTNLLKRTTYTRRNTSNLTLDYKMLYVVIVLTVLGTIMVYSGSVIAAARQGHAPYYYFVRQLLWIMVGTMLGYVVYKIHYNHLAKLALPGLGIAIFFLILVLILNWGADIKRWIPIGPFTFQPSEFAKVVLFIYLSNWLAKSKQKLSNIFKSDNKLIPYIIELILFLILLGSITILILIQPDLDTTIVIATTSFIVYFISGNDSIHTMISIILVAIFTVSGSILATLADYRLERITNWLGFWRENDIQDPFGAGYQLRQILVAVASGGFWGLGFGQSRQKFHYLGETAFTDTIFAIFAEEFGLIGGMLLILMYIYFLMRGYKIARHAPNKYTFLLAVAITTWISLQSLLHIAANVAMIPINGNTLPFFSYGGSSTIMNLVGVGILLNISKHGENLN